ncbi:hypothetical protein [Gudongella sp. DL1XJH-153]|uniref:hypothetical protein n=1 Tax=Gudongella sp. DL1XJH-153 TaxID=3409804 RepID=UPI003BB80D99
MRDSESSQINDLNIDGNFKDFLMLLQKVNPCGQKYHYENSTLIVSYKLKMDILNLWGKLSLKVNTNVVGLPISVSRPGYLGDEADVESFLSRQKGLWIVLNGNNSFSTTAKTLSTFVFKNNFKAFNDYLSALRSPYRRRISKALKVRQLISIQKSIFTTEHYLLYRDVLDRSEHPLEILPIEFFKEYDGDIYDFRSKEGDLLAFVQTSIQDRQLVFLFCGFRRENVEKYDLYFNMLLWIIQMGIENGVDEIDFGQTSEESKLKIGCEERERYLFIHHHNWIIRLVLRKLLPMFSYKSYPINHRVFKEDPYADIS